jgi:hypothetical protein
MIISRAIGLENLDLSVRNRRFWRRIQHPKQWKIGRDKALANAVSIRTVAEERKG